MNRQLDTLDSFREVTITIDSWVSPFLLKRWSFLFEDMAPKQGMGWVSIIDVDEAYSFWNLSKDLDSN